MARLSSLSHSRALVTKRHTRAHDRKGRARERTGLSRDHFGGASQIHTSVLGRKTFPLPKKSPQIEYTKSSYFLILSKMGYTNFFVKFDFVVVDWPVRESFSVKVCVKSTQNSLSRKIKSFRVIHIALALFITGFI